MGWSKCPEHTVKNKIVALWPWSLKKRRSKVKGQMFKMHLEGWKFTAVMVEGSRIYCSEQICWYVTLMFKNEGRRSKVQNASRLVKGSRTYCFWICRYVIWKVKNLGQGSNFENIARRLKMKPHKQIRYIRSHWWKLQTELGQYAYSWFRFSQQNGLRSSHLHWN